MTAELRSLLQTIASKREQGQVLINENKMDEARALVEEIRTLDAKAAVMLDLEEKDRKVIPGGLGTDGSVIQDKVKIFRASDKLSDIYKDRGAEPLSMGSYLKGAITGDWGGADRERNEFRALSTGTGQILIPTVLSANVLDLARNKSVIFGGGVPIVPMESNNLTIGKVLTDPQFDFKTEGDTALPSDMTFEGVTLNSKTAYGLMKITLEVLHSAANLDSLVMNAMAQSVANMIDSACLFGAGGKYPDGVMLNADINQIDATVDTSKFAPFVRGVGKIREANGEATTMVINAVTDTNINLLTDADGQPLQAPKVLEGLKKMISNQFPSNGGAGLDESVALVFDPNAMIVGMQVQLNVEVSREKGFDDGTVWMRIYSMLDVAVVKPKNVSKINKLK